MKALTWQKNKGFSLIEMMFGVLILVIGFVGVHQVLTTCMLLNVRNSSLTIAANDAQYVMEQIKALDYDTCIATNFSGGCYTLPVFTNLTNETVTCDNIASGTKMRQVTVKIEWEGRSGQQEEYALATFFTS